MAADKTTVFDLEHKELYNRTGKEFRDHFDQNFVFWLLISSVSLFHSLNFTFMLQNQWVREQRFILTSDFLDFLMFKHPHILQNYHFKGKITCDTFHMQSYVFQRVIICVV